MFCLQSEKISIYLPSLWDTQQEFVTGRYIREPADKKSVMK